MEKLIEKMRVSDTNVRFDELKKVCDYFFEKRPSRGALSLIAGGDDVRDITLLSCSCNGVSIKIVTVSYNHMATDHGICRYQRVCVPRVYPSNETSSH
ncbi:hypothetical protein [Corynebacterium felinum]